MDQIVIICVSASDFHKIQLSVNCQLSIVLSQRIVNYFRINFLYCINFIDSSIYNVIVILRCYMLARIPFWNDINVDIIKYIYDNKNYGC